MIKYVFFKQTSSNISAFETIQQEYECNTVLNQYITIGTTNITSQDNSKIKIKEPYLLLVCEENEVLESELSLLEGFITFNDNISAINFIENGL